MLAKLALRTDLEILITTAHYIEYNHNAMDQTAFLTEINWSHPSIRELPSNWECKLELC